MSALVKLSIRGIRNFGTENNDEARISFFSPLTLIVGQNGCGKTTIIEALKFSTCGELPAGTDNGSGFVHDPKLSGAIESRASVKLRVTNTNGVAHTVFRVIQVTQKLKRLEFKTMETTITNDETNKTITTRCSDIDNYMYNMLGVSKPILTNVIFCHQEDSDWPLNKGKVMKEKFDAIFGITEYNKCLEHIRQLIKDTAADKKLNDGDLKNKEEFRNEANSKKSSLNDVNCKLSATRDEINSYDNEIGKLQEKLAELTEKELDLSRYATEVNTLEARIDMINEAQKELRKDIIEFFTGSKEELKSKINNFERDMEQQQYSLSKLEKSVQDVLQNEQQIQNNISNERQKFGKLMRDEEQNKERLKKCDDLIIKLAIELDVSYDITDYNQSHLMEEITNQIECRTRELERLQEEQENFEKQLQSKTDKCREKRATLEHDVKTKNNQLKSNQFELKKITAHLADVDKSATILAKLSSEIDDVSRDLDHINSDLDVDELKSSITKNNSEMRKLETELTTLDEEITKLQALRIDQVELERLNETKSNREVEVKQLIDKHRDSLIDLFQEVPESNLKQKIQIYLTSLMKEIESKKSLISKKELEYAKLSANKKHLSTKLGNLQRTLSHDEDKIQDQCLSKSFDTVLSELYTKIQEKQSEKGTQSSSEYLFKRYISKVRSNNWCPLCERNFENTEDANKLIENLETKLSSLPDRLTHTIFELEGLLKKQSELLQLKPTYENIAQVRDVDIPAVRTEIAEMDKKITELRLEIDTNAEELSGPQLYESIARNILSDAVLIDQHHSELQKLNERIEKIESKLGKQAALRTLDEVSKNREELKNRIISLRKTIDSDQNRLTSHTDRVHRLLEKKNVLIGKQLKIEGGAQERNTIADKMKELKEQEKILINEIEKSELELTAASKELNDIVKKMSRNKSENKIALEKKKKKINEYERSVENINNLLSFISEYEHRQGSNALQSSKENLERLETEKNRLIEKRKSLQANINDTNQRINNQKLHKLNLDNNFKLIIKDEEKEKIQNRVNELKGSTGDIDEKDISKELYVVKEKLDELNRKKHRLYGRREELQNQMIQLENELQKDIYRNAEKAYRKCQITVTVKARVLEDLNMYYSAMDWAMIYIHKERMQLINAITRNLWRQIYRGSDIDTIEIKMDEIARTGTDRKRNYNYRVVQIRNGVEMDMPGRCSAGQKVLASLIIRMALAETFSKNFGVIALDEPTTNLDKENIESLSSALAEIVNARRSQKNFQLLVITHDEDFVGRLSQVEKVDHYLRVIRNSKGLSQVQTVRFT